MSQEKEVRDKNVTAEQSLEYIISDSLNHSIVERIALVRSMTDRLELTLDDIRNSVNSEKLDSLRMIPPDLLPFDINLSDGQKITIMETDPVVTCYDGELTNLEGDVIHVFLKNEGEELPEDFIPPRKMFTVTAQTLETVLPSIIKDLVIPSAQENKFIPGTSKKIDAPSNATNEDLMSYTSIKRKADENNKDESVVVASEPCTIQPEMPVTIEESYLSSKNSDDTAPSAIEHNVEVEVFTQSEVENISHREQEEIIAATCKKIKKSPEEICLVQNKPIKENDTSPLSSKFQVIGLVDTGILRDSGSEEGLHNTAEDFDNKDWPHRKNTATIIVDKELSDPSDFRSIFLKTPPPAPKKKEVNVRKSSRTRKPKIRSPFKSWDDLKIRLPRHSRKGRVSKGSQVTTQKIRVKKLTHKNKNVDSKN